MSFITGVVKTYNSDTFINNRIEFTCMILGSWLAHLSTSSGDRQLENETFVRTPSSPFLFYREQETQPKDFIEKYCCS